MRRTAVLLVLALVAAACGSDGEEAADPCDPSAVAAAAEGDPVVEMVDLPVFGDLLVADQAALDQLAADYLAETDDPQMERFLFGHLPVEVFDRMLAGSGEVPVASQLWLLHASGYFGGRWLRGEIAAAQPEAPLVAFSQVPTAESFADAEAAARDALAICGGADDEVALAFAYDSLFDTPAVAADDDPIPGLADNFGYNQGYLLQILEKPPEGLEASPEFDIECTDAVFDCSYASPRLQALSDLADVQEAMAEPEDDLAGLAEELTPLQEAGIPNGRAVWDGQLSVQGFPQDSYDQLLDVSSSYLEAVQATALTMVDAHAEGDAEAARRGAAANAGMTTWLNGYIAGLINGEGEIELPAFTE